MKKFLLSVLTVVFAMSSVGLAVAADKKKEKKDPEAVFKKLDADGDGKLSLAEFVGKKKDEAATKAGEAFKKKDKDADGSLSLEEFKGKPGKKKADK